MADVFMRFPGGKAKVLTLSYDDGVEQDIRLIEIMNQHGLKGTFNLNSGLYAKEGTMYSPGTVYRRLSKRQATELYGGSDQEVAVHGLTHPFLEQLPKARCTYEVLRDRENLETQFGSIVKGMAYPFGTFNDEVLESLRCAGIDYARTVVSTEDFCMPKDWLRLSATCHHDNPRLMQLAQKFVQETPNRAPWLFYLWGHSYEFEAKKNWSVMEDFAAYVGNREDIWYATNGEIYRYVKAYNQLVFSADGTRAFNPTATTLYFKNGENLCVVKSGEAKELTENYVTLFEEG